MKYWLSLRMRKMLAVVLFVIVGLVQYELSLGQSPEWINYNSTNSELPDNWIPSIAVDQFNNKWIGTVYGGVAKFDDTNWTIYNTSNSGLGAHNVQAIAIDAGNNKWFGSGWIGKISKLENETWTVYDSANTGGVVPPYLNTYALHWLNGSLYLGTNIGLLKFDGNTWHSSSWFNSSHAYGFATRDINSDPNGNLWLCQSNHGVTMYDGSDWINYNNTNSPLPAVENDPTSIAFEQDGTIWIACRYDGLVKIEGNNWTIYNTSNSGLPNNSINKVVIDQSNNKWIATGNGSTGWGNGLVKYDDMNWTVYDTSNSDIPSNDVISIAVDNHNNKWIGTQANGIAAFREGGVILSERELSFNGRIKIYPNPATTSITITGYTPTYLKLCNTLGQTVAEATSTNTLWLGNLQQGLYLLQLFDEKGNLVKTEKVVKE